MNNHTIFCLPQILCFCVRTCYVALIGVSFLRGQMVVNNVDHRPLAAALDFVEGISGVAINYEDIPYQHPADLEDVSTPAQRAEVQGYHLLVPRSGQVTATVLPGVAAASNIDLLLLSHRANGMPGDFVIEQSNGMQYVTASKVRAASGVTLDVTSPMKVKVSVPYGRRTVEDTVLLVLSSIEKVGGARIALGALPFFPGETVAFGSAEAPVRDVLAALWRTLTTMPISYRLLFDPVAGYMLNVQAVAVPSQLSPAPGKGNTPPQNPGPVGLPGYKKL